MSTSLRRGRWLALAAAAAALLALPAAGVPKSSGPAETTLAHLSQAVAVGYWASHPEQAPAEVRGRLARLRKQGQAASTPPAVAQAAAAPFNLDSVGFPQNEESVTVCHGTNTVLGGTNDYRGLLEAVPSIPVGWHLSTDGGTSVAKEGFLPPVQIAGNPTPSGGDPVQAADDSCNLFSSSLNYNFFDPFFSPNGIGVYKSDPATIASCAGGSDPACWPVRRAVAESAPNHFLDKEWFDVGVSGRAGEVVWVVYSDFNFAPANPDLPFTASIFAVRCDAALVACTSPILISGGDQDIQFGDVTIGPDGRTYITWSQIQGELEGTPQTFIHKLRVAQAGSTNFGPTRIIATEDEPLAFGGFLHANDFRNATYPKHEVVMVGGGPRIFVTWDGCSHRLFGSICEEPVIKLRYSDNSGATWSPVSVLSQGGDNYFPTIGGDSSSSRLAVAWYTNRFDPTFHNRQDVELVSINPSTAAVTKRQRLTSASNETEADPLLGGFFIGDYFEVATDAGSAYVHFNANYRQVAVLGEGVPIPQQDNFLSKAGL
jgi:hypothetical protein